MDRFEQELSAAKGQRNDLWLQERLGKITWSATKDWISKARDYDSKSKQVIELENRLEYITSGKLKETITELENTIKQKASENKGTKLLEKELEKLLSYNKEETEIELSRAKKDMYAAQFSDTCMTYVYGKVAEILNASTHEIGSYATAWGNDNEALAILKFEQVTKLKVDPIGYVAYNDYSGGSSDGLVGDDAIIEVKCPYNPANHIKSMLTKSTYNDAHDWQIQGNLLSTGRKFCYYVTFDPRVVEESLQINIIKIERNEEMIETIKERLGLIKSLLDSMLEELKK